MGMAAWITDQDEALALACAATVDTDSPELVQHIVSRTIENPQYRFRPYASEGLEFVELKINSTVLGIPVHGTPDGVVWLDGASDYPSGWYILEWKTRDRIMPREFDEMQIQAPFYQYLVFTEYGLETQGWVTVQVARKFRKLPRILKNGTISRDKSQNTDWNTYSQFVLSMGEDPEDYSEMRDALKTFDKMEVYVSGRKRSSDAALQIASVARQIESDQFKLPVLAPMTCNSCEYKHYCRAELTGRECDMQVARDAYISLDEIDRGDEHEESENL